MRLERELRLSAIHTSGCAFTCSLLRVECGEENTQPGPSILEAKEVFIVAEEILSHWYQYIPDLKMGTDEFYQQLEAALAIQSLPNAKVTRKTFAEAGLLSVSREYLRVVRYDNIFDICGMTFGEGFAVSWWLLENEGCLGGCLSIIPPLWIAYKLAVNRDTYYKIDSALMFQSVVHDLILLPTVDELIKARGLRTLTEAERVPTMREVLKR